MANRRAARFVASSQRRQSDVSVGIFYTLIGQGQFGTVDWR